MEAGGRSECVQKSLEKIPWGGNDQASRVGRAPVALLVNTRKSTGLQRKLKEFWNC